MVKESGGNTQTYLLLASQFQETAHKWSEANKRRVRELQLLAQAQKLSGKSLRREAYYDGAYGQRIQAIFSALVEESQALGEFTKLLNEELSMSSNLDKFDTMGTQGGRRTQTVQHMKKEFPSLLKGIMLLMSMMMVVRPQLQKLSNILTREERYFREAHKARDLKREQYLKRAMDIFIREEIPFYENLTNRINETAKRKSKSFSAGEFKKELNAFDQEYWPDMTREQRQLAQQTGAVSGKLLWGFAGAGLVFGVPIYGELKTGSWSEHMKTEMVELPGEVWNVAAKVVSGLWDFLGTSGSALFFLVGLYLVVISIFGEERPP